MSTGQIPQQEKYSLEELCTLVDLTRRKVKFYIENGVLARPEGTTRGAYYTHQHIGQLLDIKKWQQAGLSLERIKALLKERTGEGAMPFSIRREPGDVTVWSHIYIRDGIELLIEPTRSGLTPEQVKDLCQALQAALHDEGNPQISQQGAAATT